MLMSKKALSLFVLLSLATTGVWAADTAVDHGDSKLVKFQQAAIVSTNEAVANKLATDTNVPSTVVLSLPRTVELAYDNNHAVKEAKWAYQKAIHNVSAVAAAKNPTIGYSYDMSRGSSSGGGAFGGSSSMNSFKNGLQLKVPIYSGGSLEANIESARYDRESANAAVTQALQEAKLQAAQDYYTLIMDRNKIDINKQSVTDYEGHLTNVNQQYAVGIVAKSDVLSTQTNLANAQTTLVDSQNTANLAEATLNNIIGIPVNTTVETEDKELKYEAYPVTLEEAKAYALLHRAELIESTMAVKSAEQEVEAAKAGKLPSISATAGKNWSGTKMTGTENNNWSVGAGLTWSLWDGGQSNEKVKMAKDALEIAKEKNSAQIDSVMLDVRQAYLKMKSAEQTINSTKTAVASGMENYRIASLRYRAGVGTNLDVIDAETALVTARNNYVDALYNYNMAVAQLEQAMGIPLDIPVGKGASVVNSSNSISTLDNLVAASTQTAKSADTASAKTE